MSNEQRRNGEQDQETGRSLSLRVSPHLERTARCSRLNRLLASKRTFGDKVKLFYKFKLL